MAVEIAIVADDLSGAADCAVTCAMRGLATEVVLDPDAPSASADVLAIDANTRQLDARSAARRTAETVARHVRARWCFKKIDSTLRGHVGAEIAAALGARRAVDHRAVAIVAPAFPATGRTTVGGRQFVNGTALEETEHWARDRRGASANIVDIMRAAGLSSTALSLAALRGDASVFEALIATAAGTADALVCDAETDDDLRRLAKAAARLSQATVWAGSAGFASYLPDAAGLSPSRDRVRVPAARGAMLFVVGSPSSVSRAQSEALAAEPGVVTVEPAADAVSAALASGADVLVHPVTSASAASLARGAAGARALVLVGGETARAVLTAMGVTRFRLVDEIERGVPRAVLEGPPPRPVVTKAGAFGDRDTLLRCRRALRR